MWFILLVVTVIIMKIAIVMIKEEYGPNEIIIILIFTFTVIPGIGSLVDSDSRSIGVGLIIAAVIQGYMLKNRAEERKRRERWNEDRPNREARQRELEEQNRIVNRERERQAQELQRIEELKKKVETTAMDIAIEYEKSKYRTPADISSENLGYDIKSSDSSETRFIEVKGKSDIGSIQLTENEWNKAKELENNYYLYVVYNCLGEPRLKRVRNPANKLSANNDYKTGKYSIDKYEIDKYSE